MKTLILTAQKGGAGKTALARNLSVAAAREGQNVLLIDLDPQGSTRAWLERREGDDLSMPSETPAPAALPKLLSAVTKSFDLVVIDTPPAVPDWLDDVLRVTDLALIPVKPSSDDLHAVGKTIAAVRRAGVSFAFVMTMANPRARVTAASARALAQYGRLSPQDIGNRAIYSELGSEGLSVFEADNPQAEAEIAALWAYVKEIL